MSLVIPTFEISPADDIFAIIQDYILGIKDFYLIENLMIDLEMINDLMPDDLSKGCEFKPITYILGCF